ncbi:MAG: metal-dependent hydrolase [Patescibacteria group bacterium]
MTLPTHVLAGLIIGKITGDFPAALAGSLVMDLDHTISYFRHDILFKPCQLFKAISDEADPWGDQRNFLHSIFSWVAISILLLTINFNLGLVFSIAYFFHLVFDALDGADFYPFFPFRKFVIKGFVKYYSKQEIIFDVFLILVFATLFVV